MEFSEFNLDERLLSGIQSTGYVNCTPVQQQVIEASRDGSDLYVQSQTGTGKTAAYLIAIMQEMLSKSELKNKKALILVPTRELAVQVEHECRALCQKTDISVFSFYGGVGYEKQIRAIENDVNILVATPGRIIDLQEQNKLDLSNVGFAVIDEADRMFDMGFYPELRIILKHLPAADSRQTMLFSATLNTYVKNLAWEYTRDAKEITIEAENITVDEIKQELIHVSSDEKTRLLVGILQREKPDSTIIFCNTKKSCEIIGKRLQINGFSCGFIIGDMPQSRRLKVLNDFKSSKISILVATDVAARGIDVNDLSLVVNYDLPNEPENYVHRIGRTARAGKTGKAYTFCSEKDVYDLPSIERYIGQSIPSSVCNNELLGEDKSEGTYIKLDSYNDDEPKRYSHDKYVSGKNDRRYAGKSRKYKKHYPEGKDSFKNQNRTPKESGKDIENLSSMSFEERMEIYKKKYANSSKPSYSSNNKKTDSNDRKKQGNNYGKSKSSFKNVSQNKTGQNIKTYDSSKKGVKSQGLFARIKSLFSKKDK